MFGNNNCDFQNELVEIVKPSLISNQTFTKELYTCFVMIFFHAIQLEIAQNV